MYTARGPSHLHCTARVVAGPLTQRRQPGDPGDHLRRIHQVYTLGQQLIGRYPVGHTDRLAYHSTSPPLSRAK